MDPIILVIQDVYGPRALEVALQHYTLGRSRSASLRIFGPFISRVHAILIPDILAGKFVIFDGRDANTPSTNGLFINKLQVRSHRLMVGDRIRLGPKIEMLWETRSRLGDAKVAGLLQASAVLLDAHPWSSQLLPTESTEAAMSEHEA